MKKSQKIDRILSSIKKPARYINNEVNSHSADLSADFSIVLIFPDIYEIGASNLGLEILYHLINEKKLANCERVFAPDKDLEVILKKEKIKLFSLESNRELKSFDILGFTIQCELVATNIINILDLSDISIFSKNRKEDEPLIIAGGPALTNPEPFCDFFDLFILGDGEEVIEEVINLCKESKKNKFSRLKTLKKLSRVKGVYIPSFYNVEYNNDNTIRSITPVSKDVSRIVRKRILNLENAYFPEKKIIPFIETVHNRLNIEIARGCPGQCRFCQASKYYYPWRQRSFGKILNFVKKGIQATGFEAVSFLSLSCSDYKCLDKLLIEVNNLYDKLNLNISLPSLRCNEHSLKIIQYINRKKKPTLTFAPEAGTDRMRNVIGKYLSEKQIIETLFNANAMGWKTIKLYFMIGLPTETNEDVKSIELLLKHIIKKTKELKFNITISPFVPKAQTAFQWFPMANVDEIKQKLHLLSKLFSININIRVHDYRASIVEALIAKGDRRLSIVIYKAWQKGARFDQWIDKFDNNIWNEAISESNIDLNFYIHRNIKYDEILPWEHLHFGISKEKLYIDYVKGINETASAVLKQFEPQCFLPANYLEPKISILSPIMRLRLRFSKKGIVRFISHLEQIDMLRRATRRSGLPVAFSTGFNPKIKSSYGPPLSVGQESSSEYMELYFTQKVSVENVKIEFSKVLPRGFYLLDVKKIPLIFPTIDILSNVAEYEIKNINISQEKIDIFLSQNSIIVEKAKRGKIVELDIKPLIKSFKNEKNVLKLQLRFCCGKFVKPEIILKKLLKNEKNYNEIYNVERTKLYIEMKNGTMCEP
jgi:radical SAM family uncharacterized protein/radical SAM-linked protein